MTRGNQRDMARAKNMAKHSKDGKGERSDGMTRGAAKETDADRMRRKQEEANKKKEVAAADAAANSKGKVAKQNFKGYAGNN